MASERGGGGGAALVAVCPAITRKGTRCTQSVEGAQTYCHHHDPERARERTRALAERVEGRKAKSNPLARNLHRQLEKLAADVASGELAPYKAAVIVQVVNARIRLVELERRVQEQGELLERLEDLERSRGGGGRPWAG